MSRTPLTLYYATTADGLSPAPAVAADLVNGNSIGPSSDGLPLLFAFHAGPAACQVRFIGSPVTHLGTTYRDMVIHVPANGRRVLAMPRTAPGIYSADDGSGDEYHLDFSAACDVQVYAIAPG